MMKLQTLAAIAVGVLTATLGGFEAHAQTAAPVEARNADAGVDQARGDRGCLSRRRDQLVEATKEDWARH